jgi:outer membrane translocation and assembly module TamA
MVGTLGVGALFSGRPSSVHDRFYLGGPSSIRGFNYRSAGVLQTNTGIISTIDILS